jgi:hypothetical protein
MTTEEQIIQRGIFLPGEVPSSKNSKEIGFLYMAKGAKSTIFHLKNGTYRPVRLNLNSSKATKRYIKEHSIDYIANKVKFQKLLVGKEKPYRICFKFSRKTKRKFDYINAAQIVQDMMVKHGWIEDDDCVNVRPYFLEYEVNKENPGVLVSIF